MHGVITRIYKYIIIGLYSANMNREEKPNFA